MDKTSRIMESLWELIGQRVKWSANITSKENELTVTLINGKEGKQFRGIDEKLIESEIRQFIHLF